jgi:serine phosphatase RsbU (regulator of sigma subunit)
VELHRRDTELAVAVFRTIFLLVVLTSRRVFAPGEEGALLLEIAIIAAAGYNLALFVIHMRGVPFPRVIIVGLDVVMISLWLYFAGRSAPVYFGLYYAVVIVAGVWGGVGGAFLTSLVSCLLYAWAVTASGSFSLTDRTFLGVIAMQSLFLTVTAGVVGLVMQLQSQERQALATSRAALQQHWQRIRIAQTIDQMVRPPRLPQIAGLEIAFRYRPAAYSVSGEYYDVIRLGPRRAGICIADFAVRWEWGLQYLYAFKNSFRLAARREQSPARVLTQVNREMEAEIASDPAFQERPYAFASMCYVVIDLDRAELTYAIAGHEPPVLITEEGRRLTSLEHSGVVLNVVPEAQYEDTSVPVQSGDTLALFTDGLTEVRAPDGRFFGREGLVNCIARFAQAPAVTAFVESVFSCANEFGRQGQRRDDMTLLAVRITATDLGRQEPGAEPQHLGID